MTDDAVTYMVPAPVLAHRLIRVPMSVTVSRNPDGSTEVAQSCFESQCSWCRSRWPCPPAVRETADALLAAFIKHRTATHTLGRTKLGEPPCVTCSESDAAIAAYQALQPATTPGAGQREDGA